MSSNTGFGGVAGIQTIDQLTFVSPEKGETGYSLFDGPFMTDSRVVGSGCLRRDVRMPFARLCLRE